MRAAEESGEKAVRTNHVATEVQVINTDMGKIPGNAVSSRRMVLVQRIRPTVLVATSRLDQDR